MPRVFAGRHTASAPPGAVLFLIGMRVNRPLRVRRWLPVFVAMPRMIRELTQQPDSPLLGAHYVFLHGGPAVVQYWRSFDELDRYARDPDSSHLPAWKRFNQLVRNSGDVGIWHETYRIGDHEAIYGNMPRVGLGAHFDHRPIGSAATQTAPLRIGALEAEEPPVAPY